MEEDESIDAKDDIWMQQADDCFVNESFQAPKQVSQKDSKKPRDNSEESAGNKRLHRKSFTQIEQVLRTKDPWAEDLPRSKAEQMVKVNADQNISIKELIAKKDTLYFSKPAGYQAGLSEQRAERSKTPADAETATQPKIRPSAIMTHQKNRDNHEIFNFSRQHTHDSRAK